MKAALRFSFIPIIALLSLGSSALPLAAFPTALTAVSPPGALIYSASTTGSIAVAGGTGTFTLGVQPGQTITVEVTPSAPSLQPSVQLRDPANATIGSSTAAAANQNALIQTAAATAGGTYTIVVSGASGTIGGYTLQVILNAARENEGTIAGASNNTLGTAQSIDGSFISPQPGVLSARRGAVLGTTDNPGYMAAAVPFTFEDISATGTVIGGLTGADDSAAPIPIGFNFPFYGVNYTTIFVSSNGLLTFGFANSSFSNADLTSSPNEAAIAPFWDDQHTGGGAAGSNVFFQVLGSGANQHLTIQWNQVRFFAGGTAGDTITYEAQLYADGRIQLNYQDLVSGSAGGNNGASATVGIKDAGTQGPNRLLLAFNNGPNAFVGTGQSTLISPPSLTADYYSFTASAGDVLTVALTGSGTILDLRNSADVVVAVGAGGATNLTSVISNFVVPAPGTYYARLQGTSTAVAYSLVVTKNAAFDTEDNDSFPAAQPLAGNTSALGAISAGSIYQASTLAFSFEDITATGTVIAGLTGADDASVSIPVGFNFPLYGVNYTTIFVSSNGLLTFGSANSTFTNADLTSSPAQAAIATFWDDLQISGGDATTNVFYQVFGAGANQHLTIQWNLVRFFSGGTAGDTITFQAQLFADGRIQLNYLDLVSGTAPGNNGASATVGIKAAGAQGANRLLLAFNNGPNAFVGTGKSTLISLPPNDDWYSFNAVSPGTVVVFATSTPLDGAGEVVNALNPHLELYDPSNVLVASGVALPDGRNERIQYTSQAVGLYRARVTSDAGTTGEYTLSRNVIPPPTAAVSGTATICAGQSTTIQAVLTGATPWTLTWSDGFVQTVSASPATRSVSPTYAVTYTVTALSDANYTSVTTGLTGQAVITVKPTPSSVISSASSVCASSAGNTASVPDAGPGATYLWSVTGATATSAVDGRSVTFTAGASGNVILTVTVILNGCSSTAAKTLPIDQLPAAPVPTAPANGSTYQGAFVSWSHPGDASYDVYLDTVNPPSRFLVTGLANNFDAGIPVWFPGVTYYWQVVARNACGSTASAVQSFTGGPCLWSGQAPALLTPIANATNQGTTTTFQWNAVPGAARYDLYLGSTSTGTVLYRSIPSPQLSTTVRLAGGKTYYWKIVATPVCGPSGSASSTLQSFTTAGNGFTLTSLTPGFVNRWEGGKELSLTGSGFLAISRIFTDSQGKTAGTLVPSVFLNSFSTSTNLFETLTPGSSAPAARYDVGVSNGGIEGGRLLQGLAVRTFTDVTENDWFFESSGRIADIGVMESDIDASAAGPQFSPNAAVTRAQMAEYLAKAYQWWRTRSTSLPAASCSSPDFPDVPCSHPDWLAIHWIKTWGVTAGSPCAVGGGYCYYPNNNLTRGEILTFLERMRQAGILASLLSTVGQKDPGCAVAYPNCVGWLDLPGGPTVQWPRAEFNVAYSDRLTAGCGGSLGALYACPNDVVTRAQTATFLARMLGLVPTP